MTPQERTIEEHWRSPAMIAALDQYEEDCRSPAGQEERQRIEASFDRAAVAHRWRHGAVRAALAGQGELFSEGGS